MVVSIEWVQRSCREELGVKEILQACLGLDVLRSRGGEGNGSPLQCSCLENPMDGGAWKAAVHGVAEGPT